MKAKISKSEIYDIEIRGVIHQGFRKVDTWNGLAKYQKEGQTIIAIDDKELFGGMFGELFGGANKDNELEIVMASPSLLENNNG